MTKRTSAEDDALQEVHDDHVHLVRRLGEIEELIGAWPGSDPEAELFQVQDWLATLHEDLLRHFELEEETGLFAEALRLRPDLQPRVNRILTEHDAIRQQLTELGELARGCSLETPGSVEMLEQEYGAFSRFMRQHEKQENALIMDVYWQDLGTGD